MVLRVKVARVLCGLDERGNRPFGGRPELSQQEHRHAAILVLVRFDDLDQTVDGRRPLRPQIE
jgi:hypothetical protein